MDVLAARNTEIADPPGWLLGNVTERAERTEDTEEEDCSVLSVSSVTPEVWTAVQAAFAETLPNGPGRRHRQVFELCRALQAIPELADRPARALRDIVREWHRRALPHIRTRPFEDTWGDFIHGWVRVKFPKGLEPMVEVIRRAKIADVPAFASNYDTPEMKLLICLCRELQPADADRFFVSCRTAGRIVGIDHKTASRWLNVLVADGVLKVVEAHTTGRARRYRYLGGTAFGHDGRTT